MQQWNDDEPKEPGWYWLRWKTYTGNEHWEYQGLRVAYVQTKQIYTNGKPDFPFIEAFSGIGEHEKPIGKIDLDKLLSPQWAGPIAAPTMEE